MANKILIGFVVLIFCGLKSGISLYLILFPVGDSPSFREHVIDKIEDRVMSHGTGI